MERSERVAELLALLLVEVMVQRLAEVVEL
jgi:hypothetical protein